LQRKKIVESLQANRAETVYLLDQLVRQLPDGVYLKSVSQKVNTVTVNGYAQSNARVSTFMRNLESSPYLEKPVLIEIKALADKNSRLSEFSLSVLLTRSKEDQSPGKKPAAKPVAGAARVMPTTAELARTMVLTAPADRRHELSPASSPAFSAATAPTVIVAANIEMSDRLVQLR
jgi:Tfp pilus assembly protein PilN